MKELRINPADIPPIEIIDTVDVRQRILQVYHSLPKDRELTYFQMAKVIKRDENTVRREMQRMEHAGLLEHRFVIAKVRLYARRLSVYKLKSSQRRSKPGRKT